MLISKLKTIICATVAIVVLLPGCQGARPAEQEDKPAIPSTAILETEQAVDLEKIKPNELGQILILEYHEVSDVEGRWSRHYNNFRADLQRLYQAGYRPVSLRDVVRNTIDIPARMSPLVLTFDDGTAGQFRYIEGPDGPVVDPRCAVGILEAFHADHPDWALEATFYIYYPNPFRQPEYMEQKLRHIISRGMDIGNHTYSHVHLKRLSSTEASKELALAVKMAQRYAPEAQVDSVALPYGLGPADPAVLRSGAFADQEYKNIAALLVGAEPASAPADVSFDPYHLPRVQAIQSELDKWLTHFEKRPERRYVSDGDAKVISFAKDLEETLDKGRLNGMRVRTY